MNPAAARGGSWWNAGATDFARSSSWLVSMSVVPILRSLGRQTGDLKTPPQPGDEFGLLALAQTRFRVQRQILGQRHLTVSDVLDQVFDAVSGPISEKLSRSRASLTSSATSHDTGAT